MPNRVPTGTPHQRTALTTPEFQRVLHTNGQLSIRPIEFQRVLDTSGQLSLRPIEFQRVLHSVGAELEYGELRPSPSISGRGGLASPAPQAALSRGDSPAAQKLDHLVLPGVRLVGLNRIA